MIINKRGFSFRDDIWNTLKPYIEDAPEADSVDEFALEMRVSARSYIRVISVEGATCFFDLSLQNQKEILDKMHEEYGVPNRLVQYFRLEVKAGESTKLDISMFLIHEGEIK